VADELAGKTILLVDDDRDILTSMKVALEELGPTIITASDGDRALEQAVEHHPDLVVLDMMLPKRGGFLVLANLKEGKQRTDPPRVIMVTGNEGVRHQQYAESLGVDRYLKKPFRMERLVEAVQSILLD